MTGSQKHRDPRIRSWVFTEHGAIMAATVLNSREAVAMSVYIVRAFIRMREQLVVNTAILKRLAEIDKSLLQEVDAQFGTMPAFSIRRRQSSICD